MSEKKARDTATEFLLKMSRGEDPRRKPADEMTLREVFAHYRSEMIDEGKSESTLRDLHYAQEYCGSLLDQPISTIGRTEITRLRTKLRERGRATASRVLRNIKTAWNRADKDFDGIPPNPVVQKLYVPPPRQDRRIAWEDLPRWWEEVWSYPDRPKARAGAVRRDYWITLLLTGLRSSSCATIQWKDIDLEKGILVRPAAREKSGKRLEIPVCQTVLDAFSRRQEENRGDGGYVFPTRTREGVAAPLRERRLKNTEVLVGDAQKPWTPHDLRRTFASAATEAGVPPSTVSTLVNHALPKDTITQSYVSPSVEHLRGAVEIVEGFLLERVEQS